jgi:hypothetical protein
MERLLATIAKDSAEKAQMAALLRLSEVREKADEAFQMVDEVKEQSAVPEKTSEQARLEREMAERKAREALEEQSKAVEAITGGETNLC